MFTVIGGLAGLAGFGLAVAAKFDSQRANEIAGASRDKATEANCLAADSNRIAVEARDLAEDANTISRRAEARETEPNYVSWDYNWPNAASCQVTNTGQDKALRVRVTVAVEGEYLAHPPIDVDPGTGVVIALPRLLEKLRHDREKFRTEQQSRVGSSDLFNPAIAYAANLRFPRKLDVVVTIQWFTPLGKQRERVIEDRGHPFLLE
ncbi:hypothetical protein [Corynebacterium sanguinis]|uniref:hypothetical protein n=1 Tax=Corynebacterium sanguinis TaxID=2594913 RepID=UPI0021A8BB86|nr:hypothetical protein [Corynebacterium sanguinis]MCT1463369.1 hypothetical protein [Corynebacterium sanguinis]MCT2329985.1 hypothetical protein [Corynebacterium sanguinis]